MIFPFSFIRNIFCSNKKNAPATTTLPPPPEYRQICPPEAATEKRRHSHGESQYLNPNLHFTADEIEAHLAVKDARFAAAVVELMLPRLELGVWSEPVGWGHYSYALDKKKETGCHSDACQCNRATGWDNIIGFKAWEYVSRFLQVSELVKRDLELRGFAVDKVEVYPHKCSLKDCRGGVFVKWEIQFPTAKDKKENNQSDV